MSNLPPVLTPLSLTGTRVQIIRTPPQVECILVLGGEKKYLWAVGTALAKLGVKRVKMFSYVLHH